MAALHSICAVLLLFVDLRQILCINICRLSFNVLSANNDKSQYLNTIQPEGI